MFNISYSFLTFNTLRKVVSSIQIYNLYIHTYRHTLTDLIKYTSSSDNLTCLSLSNIYEYHHWEFNMKVPYVLGELHISELVMVGTALADNEFH